MTTYEGVRLPTGGVRVTKDGEPLPLWRSYQVRVLSPAGFDWGHGGAGPAALALALLLEELEEPEALQHYERFKWEIISHLMRPTWSFTSKAIHRWAAQQWEEPEEETDDPS